MFKIKICGVTNAEDAARAVAAGADAIGLNFYSQSPRYVSENQARQIVAAIPADIVTVGVFVNASFEQMTHLAARVPLSAIQLHGDEPAEMVSRLGDHQVVRAFRLKDGQSEPLLAHLEQCEKRGRLPAAVLVDAYSKEAYGGTGERADWELASLLKDKLGDTPLILAGGLTAENVAEAIHAVQPFGVDVASGVEIEPGRKDRDQVQQFVQRARTAFAE